MRKEKPVKEPTPQRFSWKTHAIVDTYTEADTIRTNLKNQHKKICFQQGRFHVKIGTPVKVQQVEQ